MSTSFAINEARPRKHIKDCEFVCLKDDLMLHVLIQGIDCERTSV